MRGESMGHDELWAEFFTCTGCGKSNIIESHMYCPDCGLSTTPEEKDKLIELGDKVSELAVLVAELALRTNNNCGMLNPESTKLTEKLINGE